METSDFVRSEAPSTEGEDEQPVFLQIGYLVECADVFGGETRCIGGLTVGGCRPVELLVKPVSRIDGGPPAPD